MRVTQQSLSLQVADGLQQAFSRLAATQEAVTTGKRINRLSDDPMGAVRVLGLKNFEASLTQFNKNVNTALPVLEQTDSVLDSVTQLIVRAKELAIAMANDSNSAKERVQTSKEIHEVFNEILSLSNTRVENRYIFAGFANGSPPFAFVGGGVLYNGDSGVISVSTSATGTVALNVPGDQVFQGLGLGGGDDIFDMLLDLETALLNDDVNGSDGIRTQIGRLDVAIDQLLGFRAEFGARVNHAQAAKAAVDVIKTQTIEQRSQIEDADALKVYSDFARYQQAFQAALNSAAQMIRQSLMDFLR